MLFQTPIRRLVSSPEAEQPCGWCVVGMIVVLPAVELILLFFSLDASSCPSQAFCDVPSYLLRRMAVLQGVLREPSEDTPPPPAPASAGPEVRHGEIHSDLQGKCKPGWEEMGQVQVGV